MTTNRAATPRDRLRAHVMESVAKSGSGAVLVSAGEVAALFAALDHMTARARELEAQRDDYLQREWIAERAKRRAESELAKSTELLAQRVQDFVLREFNECPPVQDIEQAMRTPCSCPFTEASLSGERMPAAAPTEVAGG
jgi:hypothetical protein